MADLDEENKILREAQRWALGWACRSLVPRSTLISFGHFSFRMTATQRATGSELDFELWLLDVTPNWTEVFSGEALSYWSDEELIQ